MYNKEKQCISSLYTKSFHRHVFTIKRLFLIERKRVSKKRIYVYINYNNNNNIKKQIYVYNNIISMRFLRSLFLSLSIHIYIYKIFGILWKKAD